MFAMKQKFEFKIEIQNKLLIIKTNSQNIKIILITEKLTFLHCLSNSLLNGVSGSETYLCLIIIIISNYSLNN